MSDHHKPLRLLAKDVDNLHIFSAMLQDSLMPITAMVFDEKAETFSILANRFCWELPDEIDGDEVFYHRVHAGLAFQGVHAVKKKNFDQVDAKRILYFLNMVYTESDKTLMLHFAEGVDLCLYIRDIDAVLADIDHPWPTQTQPMHVHQYLEEMSLSNKNVG